MQEQALSDSVPAAPAVVFTDRWLTDVVGRPVFRIDGDALADRPLVLAAAVGRHIAEQHDAMYDVKVPTDRVDLVQALGEAGVSIVDVAMTFTLDAEQSPRAEGVADVRVDDVTEAQAPEVLEIAGSCFRFSRFHLDPRVPAEVAHRIKREWILNYVLKRRGERLLVATLGGRPAGFLAVLASESAGIQIPTKTRTIDLVGVAPWAQRRGVGRALVQAFIDVSRDVCQVLQVGTQAANIPSMRLYEGFGFRLSRSQYVLHGHVSR